MARKSTIEWTNSTWNPVTGCTKVSAGVRPIASASAGSRGTLSNPVF